jgi:streptomycin 6-kinase
MLDVPQTVRSTALAVGAAQWLADLPSLVADIEHDWSLVVGRPFADGHGARVAEAGLGDGTSAVLKLVIPQTTDVAMHEITVLRLAKGDSCARLLQDDASRGALLMERLGQPLFEFGYPLQTRLEILSELASRLWRPAPDCGLPTGAAKGRWLVDFITTTWEELGRPCSERVIAHALTCAQRRIAAHDDERSVLVHGDVHQWNALHAADGFKLVDPDGLLAEAEYDVGVLMRGDPVELLHGDAYERAEWLAARTGLNAIAIWEWGVVERVSSGLLCTKLDLQPAGSEMLAAAERVAD